MGQAKVILTKGLPIYHAKTHWTFRFYTCTVQGSVLAPWANHCHMVVQGSSFLPHCSPTIASSSASTISSWVEDTSLPPISHSLLRNSQWVLCWMTPSKRPLFTKKGETDFNDQKPFLPEIKRQTLFNINVHQHLNKRSYISMMY